MLPFSAWSKTDAPETSLRMSRPEAGVAITPTVTAPGSGKELLVLAVEELPDETVDLPRRLHLRHVPRTLQDLYPGLGRQALRVRDETMQSSLPQIARSETGVSERFGTSACRPSGKTLSATARRAPSTPSRRLNLRTSLTSWRVNRSEFAKRSPMIFFISLRRFAAIKPAIYSPLISSPRPALAMRVRDVTLLGWASANEPAIAPPIECPTRWAFSTPISSRKPARVSTNEARSPSPTSLVEPPWPGRSSA